MTVFKTSLGAPNAGQIDFEPTGDVARSDLQRAVDAASQGVGGSVSGAPTDAEYIVSTADGTLTNERVLTDTATVTWDSGTSGQMKANWSHLGLEALSDPGADRLFGWDDGAGASAFFSAGTGLGFVGTQFSITDAELVAIAGLTSAADGLPYFTGSGTAGLATLTAFGRSLIDDANAGAALTTLGVSTFGKTLIDDASAADALTTLGVSSFLQNFNVDEASIGDGDILVYDAGTQTWIGEALGADVGAPGDAGYYVTAASGALSNETVVPAFIQTLLDDTTQGAAQTTLGLGGGDSPTFSGVTLTPATAPAHTEGRVFYDDTYKALSYYTEEADVTLNIGRELFIRVWNASGSTITNGQAIHLEGYDATSDLPTVILADATLTDDSRFGGLATHNIENNSAGYVTKFGRVSDIDTSGLTEGDEVWLDPATPGGFTTTRPTSPNYAVLVGVVVKADASTGSIFVGGADDNGGVERIASGVYNGTCIQTTDVNVTSNGTTITLSVEANGGGDLTLIFNSLPQTFDATPAATVALTAGSDASPQINYVYILQSTGNLTVSTSSFPAAQHVPIATVLCQSAASLQTDGAMKVHVWTDHIAGSDSQGHLSHLNRWIRTQDATWQSGVALTPTAGASQLDIATSAGVVLQLHDHAFPAFDTSGGDVIYVVNDPDAAYTQVASLTQADGVDKDANGDTLGAAGSDFYNLVIWGAISEDAADCKLFCNLPFGYYANDNGSQASDDTAQTAVYSIPSDFRGVGFLIARLTISESGGTYSVVNQVDLRGQRGTALSGGGATGGNEFFDNVFRINDDGDSTKQLAFSVGGISTTTTRTLTVQDASGTILLDGNIGSTVQAWGADLDAIAALAKTDGNFIVGNGTAWVAESGATARTSLGLGTIATQNADSVSISGGSITGITDIVVADGGTGRGTATAYAVLCGGTTAIGAQQSIASVGSSGQVLTSNGASALPTFQASPLNVAIQVFTSSGTYTPTSGMTYCIVLSTGGGGGSGGAQCSDTFATFSYALAGHGGAASTSIELFSAAQIGANQTVTIGAAGTAGASSGGNGGAGGTTTFGALHSAAGGAAGAGATSATSGTGDIGDSGAGGTATGGLLNLPGGGGLNANGGTSGFVLPTQFGAPGRSLWGGAQDVETTNIVSDASKAGVAGSIYGAGARGAVVIELSSDQAAASGAAGGGGLCVVIEFFT